MEACYQSLVLDSHGLRFAVGAAFFNQHLETSATIYSDVDTGHPEPKVTKYPDNPFPRMPYSWTSNGCFTVGRVVFAAGFWDFALRLTLHA